ncbi:MAG: glycoside hydrolase family 172 protein, partial [Planctomycetota bacterium]
GDGGVWNEPSLAYGVSIDTPHDRRGHNLFVPIPYAKSCRITYETDQNLAEDGRIDESFYYHVGYRTYPLDTPIETFTLDRWKALQGKRTEVAKALSGEPELVQDPARKKTAGSGGTIEFTGPAAVDSISVDASGFSPQQLRSTLISLTFDGVETVRVPLDGFFTCGYLPKSFRTWMHSYSDGVMRCHYVMPFQNSCVAKLVTANGTAVNAPLSLTTKPWQWNDRSMHFHADWRTDQNLSTGIAKTQDRRDGVVDLGFLDATGRGVLVGDSIMLFSGAARWWGEGDEKIFVDGEAFPSHFGTGTEDYYGYAWCRPETFFKPFHAQPVGRGALLGGPVVNTRIRSLDAIPFHRSIDFDMELWHWSDTKVNYARTVFWYGRPGATASGSTPERAGASVAVKDTDITAATTIEGAIEGESAKVVSVSGGEVVIDRYTLFGWSGGAQLLWKNARPGDELVLEFEKLPQAPELLYTAGPDYGGVEVNVGGTKADLRGRLIGVLSVLQTRRQSLVDCDPNAKRMTIRMTGSGNAPKRFGIDAIVPGEATHP